MSKPIHIVFQVLNFIQSPQGQSFKLSDDEQMLLLTLARFKGEDGIYPSLVTVAKRRGRHLTSVHKTLRKLEEKNLVITKKSYGKVSHYELSIPEKLSTTHSTDAISHDPTHSTDAMSRTHSTDATTPIASTRLTHSTGATQYKTYNQNIINNTERDARKKPAPARKKRLPLSDHFKPNEQNQKRLSDTAQKSGKSADDLLQKFKNIQKAKDGLSADWQAELENFLMNERPLSLGSINSVTPKNETKSAVQFWGPGHPSWEALHAKKSVS